MPEHPPRERLPQPPENPEKDPSAYRGLSREEARRRAEAKGWRRIREFDGKPAAITMEWMGGRINLVTEDGQVTDCWFG